jgi:hypothetical protein
LTIEVLNSAVVAGRWDLDAVLEGKR